MIQDYSILDDQQLIDYLKEGNHFAFNEIYKRFWRMSINTAFQRLKSKEMAEEVVQEVFVSLFIRRASIQLKSSLEAYIRLAIKNRIIDAFRAQKSQEQLQIAEANNEEPSPAQPDEALEYKELRDKIKSSTDKLPEKCREVFLMSRFEHLSHQEISDRTGISISTVKKHINKALKILKEDFQDQHLDILIVCLFVFSQS